MRLDVRRTAFWALAALFWAAGTAEAHKRNYLDTYGYYTLEKGEMEVELWTDFRDPAAGRDFWFHQTEVEYGVTDRYTLGLYGVFVDGKGFTAAKLENRYRLSEPKEWPVDTALYLEFKDANDNKDEDEIEGKVIVSKEWRKWNFTANGILEMERELEPSGEKEWEFSPALAVGAAYQGLGRVTPGVEFLFVDKKSRIVPGVYIDLLPDVRLNLGLGLGLVNQADDVQIKSILEIEF